MAGPDSETLVLDLGHRTQRFVEYEGSGDSLVTTTYDTYTLTRVTARRPMTGFRRLTTTVRCGECGKEFRCRCYSPYRARWRLRRRKILGWGTLLPALTVWYFAVSRAVHYGNAPLPRGTSGLIALSVFGILMVVVGIAIAREDKDLSVRLHGDRLHELRAGGSTGDVFRHETPPVPL